jgi:hypothetical protein
MKTIALMFAGLMLFIVIVAVMTVENKGGTPAPPEPPKTRAQIEDDHYGMAEYGCERWTENNSKLEVDKVLGWYKLKKTKPGFYSVRIEYRAKPLGLIMLSDCTYKMESNQKDMMFVRGFSRAE